MIDQEAVAARLYGTDNEQPATTSQQPASDEEARLARMFPTSNATKPEPPATQATDKADTAGTDADPGIVVPTDIVKLRAESPDARAERLYGETPHDAVTAAMRIDNELPDNTRMAVSVELSKITRDLGLEDGDVRYLTQRVQQLKAAPVSCEAASKEVVDALNREFGDQAAKAFAAARALAHRDPRVVAMLDASGLGNDARTIVMLARRGFQERIKGRLK